MSLQWVNFKLLVYNQAWKSWKSSGHEQPHWMMIRHLRNSSSMRGAASAYAKQSGLGFTLKSSWWPSTCAQQAHHPRCAYEFPRGHPHAVCIKTHTMQRSIRAERHCTLIDNQHHANAIANLVCLNDSRFSHMETSRFWINSSKIKISNADSNQNCVQAFQRQILN